MDDAIAIATAHYAAGNISQRDLVVAYMQAHRGEFVTPAQVSKAVTPEGSARLGLRDCMAKLCQEGVIERTLEEKVSYMLP